MSELPEHLFTLLRILALMMYSENKVLNSFKLAHHRLVNEKVPDLKSSKTDKHIDCSIYWAFLNSGFSVVKYNLMRLVTAFQLVHKVTFCFYWPLLKAPLPAFSRFQTVKEGGSRVEILNCCPNVFLALSIPTAHLDCKSEKACLNANEAS